MLVNPQQLKHEVSEQLSGVKLMQKELLTKVMEKTLITSNHYQRVEQINSAILGLYPNIRTDLLAEIKMVLLNEMTVRPNDK